MRSIAAQVISLLLLSQLVVDVVHGIRLDKESLVALTKQIHLVIKCIYISLFHIVIIRNTICSITLFWICNSADRSLCFAWYQEKLENQEGISANEKDLLHKCGEKCRGATKESTVRKSKEGHDHMIPTFHEDYYGPRGHKPTHH